MKKIKLICFCSILFSCGYKNKQKEVFTNQTVIEPQQNHTYDTIKATRVNLIFCDYALDLPQKIKSCIYSASNAFFKKYQPIYQNITIYWNENGGEHVNRGQNKTRIAGGSVGSLTIFSPRNSLLEADSLVFYGIILHELTHTQRGARQSTVSFTMQGIQNTYTVDSMFGLSYIIKNDIGYEALEESSAEFIAFSVDSVSFYAKSYISPEYLNSFYLMKSVCNDYKISPADLYNYQIYSQPDLFMKRIDIWGQERADILYAFTSAIMLDKDWYEIKKNLDVMFMNNKSKEPTQ